MRKYILIVFIAAGLGFSLTASAAINFVQEKAITSGGSPSATTTVTGVAAGDLLLIDITFTNTVSVSTIGDTNGTVTFIASTTWHGSAQNYFYYVANTAAGTHAIHYTMSGAVSFPAMNVMEYSGAATSSPLDSSSTATGSGSGASIVGNSVTSTAAGDLIAAEGNTAGDTISAGPGYALRVNNNAAFEDNAFATGTVLGANQATSTAFTTQSAGVDWTVLSALFKPQVTSTPSAVPSPQNRIITMDW